ncbi:MAG: pyrroline-5-carboxylate reductase [Candidatus Aminicenantaceae bacterium]
MSLTDKTIAFIGGGHITEIVIDNLIRTKTVPAEHLIVSDPDVKRHKLLAKNFSVKTTSDNLKAVGDGDIIFINLRAQDVNEVVAEFSPVKFSEGQILVTLASGVPMRKYRSLGEKLAIVRALPNPPSRIGRGVIAIDFNAHVSDSQKKDILELFDPMGVIVFLKEEYINAVTSLSSPASILVFFESMIEAGVRMGIDKDTSAEISYQTIIGVLEVWKQRRTAPDILLKEACTPGGISVESVSTLEKYDFRTAVIEAIQNGADKAKKLGG